MSNAPATIVPSALFLELKGKSKITLATVKSFIRKNRENLLVKVSSRFSGMSDMVEPLDKPTYRKAEKHHNADETCKNSLGIAGVWMVGGSRDLFTVFQDGDVTGIECYNCTGTFSVGIKTGA